MYEAAEILARLRARFRVFELYAQRVLDRAGIELEVSTPFGWVMQTPPGTKHRTTRNFPMQSTGSEVLHVASIMAERRGVQVVAPVHDAIMAEAAIAEVADVSAALDRVMRDAGAVVLRGYELPTDVQVVLPGQHYHDDRGVAMWNTVTNLVAKLERRESYQ